MEPEHIPKMAIVALFGLSDFVQALFGLWNVAQTFQRFIDQILHDFLFICIYVNDILFVGWNIQDHISHVRQVFECLKQYGIVINPIKCVFSQTKVTFLGYHISVDGISPWPDKVKSIQDSLAPWWDTCTNS